MVVAASPVSAAGMPTASDTYSGARTEHGKVFYVQKHVQPDVVAVRNRLRRDVHYRLAGRDGAVGSKFDNVRSLLNRRSRRSLCAQGTIISYLSRV
jgi:hypothetical protein